MDIGIVLWVWGAPITDEHVETYVPKAAEMGFDTVEFPMEEPESFDYDRAEELLDEHDLRSSVLVAMEADRDLLHDDPAIREQGREYIRASIDAAAGIGADRICGPLYSAVGRTWYMDEAERAAALDTLEAQFQEVSEYAADRGVTLCLEPLNRYETSVFNTADQMLELIDRVDHPNCQVLLDSFHMNVEETDPAAAIRRTGDRLGHFHACRNDRGAPGSGNIDWASIADALDDAGYDDQAVIESFTPDVKAIARAASIWRPLAESQDALAADGLANLRSVFRA